MIYIKRFVFYAARINYQFKISELKNGEKLVEQTVQALKSCQLRLEMCLIYLQMCDLHSW